MPTLEYRAVLVGDVHLSDKAPRSRKDDYTEAIFTKIQEINDIAEKVGADHIIQAGDMFHVKAPSRNSHSLVRRTIQLLKSSKSPWIINPGNHDLPNGRMDQLPRQPLAVLYTSGAAQLPVPGIIYPSGIGQVLVHGAPFTYDMDKDDETREVYYPASLDFDFVITVSHGTVIHGMDSFYVDYTNPRHFDISRCADVMFNGHLHFGFDDETIYDSSKKRTVTFVNPGSISRGSLHEYNAAEQRVKVKILKARSRFDYDLQDYYLQTARPPEEVLAFEEKEEQASKDAAIEIYVDSIADMISTMEYISSYQELVDSINSMKIEPEVRKVALELLGQAHEATL